MLQVLKDKQVTCAQDFNCLPVSLMLTDTLFPPINKALTRDL